MPKLPWMDSKKHVVEAPHVVILGAGASLASCPEGDALGRPVPLMKDLVEVVGLRSCLEDLGITSGFEDFEGIYDTLANSGTSPEKIRQIEERVWRYFASLRLPGSPTVYDYLLLTLRSKDLVATFNWDPFLAQAYRRHRRVRELPNILFLHGNVEVGICERCRVKGWVNDLCGQCHAPLGVVPLLYPVKDKNYQANIFIHSEWRTLQEYLGDAYFLTIFGYSAPRTDAAARELMHSVWQRNQSKELAEVEVVDVKPLEEVRSSWQEFIVGGHYLVTDSFFKSYQMWHPRRSCDALAGATLMLEPWDDDWMPKMDSLESLRAWVRPLVQEELMHHRERTGFSRLPGTRRSVSEATMY